jgi:hypothetical protein
VTRVRKGAAKRGRAHARPCARIRSTIEQGEAQWLVESGLISSKDLVAHAEAIAADMDALKSERRALAASLAALDHQVPLGALRARCVHVACALRARCVRVACALRARCVRVARALRARCVRVACALRSPPK